jgi:nickel/cobalt exporter
VTRARLLTGAFLAACAVVTIVTFSDFSFAQVAGPFGAPRPPSVPQADGVIGWILTKQAEFYRQFSGLIRAAKTDGIATWTLFGAAFLYGIFHAAGPGHGKAVISSYMIANDETWRRGVILSFVSAMIQSIVAVLLVGIAAGIIGVTSRAMGETVRWIEIASYGLIALLGLQLTWTKGRGFLAALRGDDMHDHDHHHAHDQHGHHDHTHDACAHEHHTHDHVHATSLSAGAVHPHHDHAGHSHGPMPEELAGPGGWRRGFEAVFAVGLRPCSGSILVLVFALAQGLFWAGVVATFMIGLGTALTVAAIATLTVAAKSFAARLALETGTSRGALIVGGLELLAALLVLAFGVALLLGYMTTERMF